MTRCPASADNAAESDAANCSLAVQKDLKTDPVVPLRIGLHIGEVFFEGDKALGDGVNVASRIQSLGQENTILVSGEFHDKIKNNSAFTSVSLGQFDFKNVDKPLEVYALTNVGLIIPDRNKMEGKLKKKQIISKYLLFSLSIIPIVIAGYFIYKNLLTKNDTVDIADKSIAVLPFVNMSNDKDQEYFSDGLSEELLNLLAKIPELKVIGRTSSFSFKGKNEDLRVIAEKLGVAHLLEGSVRKDGNKIRVTAQLIKAKDGSHMWSETYDRNFEDVFKLQDEIAGAVVKQLKLKLLSVPGNITSSSTNTEVYNLVLQGNYFLEKRGKENLVKALGFYSQALAIDSLNARTWGAMARSIGIQADWAYIDVHAGFKKAEIAANKAIALDEKQAEGYIVLGSVKMNSFDWRGSEAELKKGISLNPGNADLLNMLGYLYVFLGRFDEAIQLTKQSLAHDPILPVTYFYYGYVLYCDKQYDKAIEAYKTLIELNPQFPRAHYLLSKVYLSQGKPELALIEMPQETETVSKILGLALTYHALGRKKEADETMNDFLLQYQHDWPYQVAELYAFRGEINNAFAWLEKVYVKKDSWLSWLKADPLLENLWYDPRYNALLKKMNLPLR